MKLFSSRIRNVEAQFLGSGMVAALLAAGFSLIYSQDLGAERRGIISVIFISTLVFSSVSLGGLNITFRSHRGAIHPSTHTSAFLHISIVGSLIVGSFVMFATLIYSSLKTPIALPLVLIAGSYGLISTLYDQLLQVLLAKNIIGLRWKLDLFAVSSQILIYLSLKRLGIFSFAIDIFLAYMLSYSIVVAIILTRHSEFELFNGFGRSQRIQISNLFRSSSSNYIYSILVAVTDRIDRILVLVFFSTQILGKYAFLTGALTFTRFLPDAVSNLIVARRMLWLDKHLHVNSRLRLVLLLSLAAAYGYLLQQAFIGFFGEEWRLPILISPLFALGELLRSAYTAKISFYFQNSKSTLPAKSAAMLLGFSCILPLLLRPLISLASVPLGLTLAYALTFKILKIFPTSQATKNLGGARRDT